jgi:hypothetical protein
VRPSEGKNSRFPGAFDPSRAHIRPEISRFSGRRCSPRCRRAPRARRVGRGGGWLRGYLLPHLIVARLVAAALLTLIENATPDTVDRAAEAGETLWVLPEVPKRHPATSSTAPRLSQRHKPLRRGIDEHTEGRPSGLVDRELRKTKFIGVASQCFGVRSDADPRSHSHPLDAIGC